KTGDRIFRCILALALRASAHILGLGERAQQAILILGQFSPELGDPRLWRRFRGFRLDWRASEAVDIVIRCVLRSSGERLLLLSRRIVHGVSYPISRP